MKQIKSLLTVTAIMIIITLISCGSKTNKREKAMQDSLKAQENTQKMNEEYETDMANYKKDIQAKIEENNKKIGDLRANIKNQKAAGREEYKSRIDDLQRRNEDLRMKMDNYQGSGKDKWEEFKREFNHDMDELGKALEDLTKNNVK
jgi:peptidoglycan hydrolase CwlO-like protein